MQDLATFPDLAGKVVVVTGGAANLGRGTALAFANQGAHLVIADIDHAQSERTATVLRQTGARVLSIVGDLTEADFPEAVVGRATDEFGHIDVLVNNAGWLKSDWFLDAKPSAVNRMLALNLGATITMTQAALPGMVERRSGNVVNLSSDAAFGDARMSVYGATKAGIIALTKSLAKEYGRYGVRFNAIAPGLVEPPGSDWIGGNSLWAGAESALTSVSIESIARSTPLQRLTSPADVAAAALFFASDLTGRQLTGQVISVSGGYAMP